MISREKELLAIREGFDTHPVVSILGPRQCGKSTLARMFCAEQNIVFFDLENPVDRRRLESPMQTLSTLKGLVVLDEIQRSPELFEILRVLADRPDHPARFLVLGSAAPSLLKGISESLAGRVTFVDLSGFSLSEVGGLSSLGRLWLRGGFPRSYLAASDSESFRWREDFVRTFLERDIPQLGITVPSGTLLRFWTMIAHYHGQVWNAAELARSLGASEPTARRYLDILAGAYMVRILPPWFENIGKRQVKSPKIYLRDSGILHTLMELPSLHALQGHPKLGASWEGFALEQLLGQIRSRQVYFWSTHGGAELDLFVLHNGKRYGFEFKYADAPGRTRSMHSALKDLNLAHLWVIYPGTQQYALDDKITVCPLDQWTVKQFEP